MILRLSQYIDYKGLSVRAFEMKIGASDGLIRRAIKNHTDIQSKWITNIAENYPDLSLRWLLLGVGHMTRDTSTVIAVPESPNTIIGNDVNDDIPVAQYTERGGIPLLSIDVAAGVLSGNDLQIMPYECEHYIVPGCNKADFLVRVDGDSMLPKYEKNDIVACQKVPLDLFFRWNEVYVVSTREGIVIKRVRKGNDKQHLTLVSENPEYQPIDLPLDEVTGIGRVIALVRMQ